MNPAKAIVCWWWRSQQYKAASEAPNQFLKIFYQGFPGSNCAGYDKNGNLKAGLDTESLSVWTTRTWNTTQVRRGFSMRKKPVSQCWKADRPS